MEATEEVSMRFPAPQFPEPRLPDLQQFALQFRQKYGREMTASENRFYQLTKDLLADLPDEEHDNGGVSQRAGTPSAPTK